MFKTLKICIQKAANWDVQNVVQWYSVCLPCTKTWAQQEKKGKRGRKEKGEGRKRTEGEKKGEWREGS